MNAEQHLQALVTGRRAPKWFPLFFWENHFAHFALWIFLISAAALGGLAAAIHQTVSGINALRRNEFASDVTVVTSLYDTLRGDLRATERERALLPTVRFPRGNPLAFVQTLETVARSVGVQQTIAVGDQRADGGERGYATPVLRYTLTLQGSEEAVVVYLQRLHEVPYLVRVERVSLNRVAPRPDEAVTAVAVLEIVVAVRE